MEWGGGKLYFGAYNKKETQIQNCRQQITKKLSVVKLQIITYFQEHEGTESTRKRVEEILTGKPQSQNMLKTVGVTSMTIFTDMSEKKA